MVVGVRLCRGRPGSAFYLAHGIPRHVHPAARGAAEPPGVPHSLPGLRAVMRFPGRRLGAALPAFHNHGLSWRRSTSSGITGPSGWPAGGMVCPTTCVMSLTEAVRVAITEIG